MSPLLQVNGLRVSFAGSDARRVQAVQGLDFAIAPGEILGVVGESGSGKSAAAMAILRLLPRRTSRIDAGSVLFNGRDLASASERDMLAVRGREIALIPQEPMSALNPTLTIGRQFWLIQRRSGRSPADVAARAATQLKRMGLNESDRILASYPFQLSGGQRQRVLIAMAFVNDPALIIADEPTTALDVTVQAEVLSLLTARTREAGKAMMFITHNLGVAWGICDSIIVMRRGEIVERGPARSVLQAPSHPYTRALIGALPGGSAPRTPLLTGEAI